MKLQQLLFCAASIVLCACSSETEEHPVQAGDVTFTGSITPITRATDSAFENDDAISVYAKKQNAGGTSLYADCVRYTWQTSANAFTASSGGIIVPQESTQYYAIYPYQAYTHSDGQNASLKFNFTIQTNQNNGSNYTLSDLCTATSSPTTAERVDLTFSHRLSKLVVNVMGSSIPSDMTIQLKNVQTGVNMDLQANTFTASGSRANVTMGANGNNSFRAIIPTQTVSALIITKGGKTSEVVVNKALAAGRQSELTVEVQGDTYVVISGGINNWEEDNGGTTDEVLFEEPCLQWGATVSAVKNFMSAGGYELARDITANSDGSAYLMVYLGKHKEWATFYSFTSQTSGLTDAFVLLDKDDVTMAEVLKHFDDAPTFQFVMHNEEYGVYRYVQEADDVTLVDISEDDEDIQVNYYDYAHYTQVKGKMPSRSQHLWKAASSLKR